MGKGPGLRAFLLPERHRLAGEPSAALSRTLARANVPEAGAAGEQAQLQRWFKARPSGWPLAALQRQAEAVDAGAACWLRADPVHVRVEMSGARLLGWSNLGLDAAEADALILALSDLLAEDGIDIGRTTPEAWYLRLPPDTVVPDAVAPGDALGDDLLPHLPAGDAGRRWRRLLNDAQVILHSHPVNAARSARGQMAANALWLWGGGVLPQQVSSTASCCRSDEPALHALARAASIDPGDTPASDAGVTLLDLRRLRDWTALEARLRDCNAARTSGGPRLLDFADGTSLLLHPAPRWAFWRRGDA